MRTRPRRDSARRDKQNQDQTSHDAKPEKRFGTKHPKTAPGNGGSLEKCRRRWDLADAEFLRYKFLAAFDR